MWTCANPGCSPLFPNHLELATPRLPSLDAIDITAKNISNASISVRRAHVDCKVLLHISTDGPLSVTLPGCARVVHATGTSGPSLPVLPLAGRRRWHRDSEMREQSREWLGVTGPARTASRY